MQKIERLIPCSAFVLHESKQFETSLDGYRSFTRVVIQYSKFLQRALELWMFVPCDPSGKPIAKPERPLSPATDSEWEAYDEKRDPYIEAKDRCLFEGFVLDVYNSGGSFQIVNSDKSIQICTYKAQPDYFIWNFKTIEEISHRYELQLTPTALKEIYGS